jgi:hypothetical protein
VTHVSADAKGDGGAGRTGSKVIVDASGNPISDGGGNLFKSNPCITISVVLLVILSSVIVVLATSTTVLDAYIDRSTNDNTLLGNDDDRGALITDEDLDFTFYRSGYDVLDQFLPEKSTVLKYKFLSTYDGVIEPFGSMHLLPLSFDDYTSYDYKYTVCPDAKSSDSSAVECKHGDLKADGSETPFAIACDPFDTFKVQVTEYYSDDAPSFAGKTRRTADGAMMCMYVRRELRTLTESDLNDTMTAMATLWTISGTFAFPLFSLLSFPLSSPCSSLCPHLSLSPSLPSSRTLRLARAEVVRLRLLLLHLLRAGPRVQFGAAELGPHARRRGLPPAAHQADQHVRELNPGCQPERVRALLGLHVGQGDVGQYFRVFRLFT